MSYPIIAGSSVGIVQYTKYTPNIEILRKYKCVQWLVFWSVLKYKKKFMEFKNEYYVVNEEEGLKNKIGRCPM